MKAPRIISVISLLSFLPGAAATPGATDPADLLLVNGNIYTVDEHLGKVSAVAVTNQRIMFAGSNDEATQYRGGKTRVIDLAGKTVVPGFTDAHCHIFGIGEREMSLNLEGTTSRESFFAKVKERAGQTPPGKWITGRGWIETFWNPPKFPSRQDLDGIAPEHPVWLERADGHAAIANGAALQLAGIDSKTPDPFGGQILKDKRNGEPTGVLLDKAQDLVSKNIPEATDEEREKALLLGIERELSLGWCQIQNAGSDARDRRLLRKAFAEKKAKIRIYNAVYGPGPEAEKLLRDGRTVNEFDHHFTERTIKVVFDGALGSRGAALLEPYADAPETSGYLREKPEALRPMFQQALKRGIQIETHAIGDRANRMILDLYKEAFAAVPPDDRKEREPWWRVEHAQILDPADIPRFAELRVIPSMQPSHAISDLFFAPARLGPERLAGAYAWKSLFKTNIFIAAGSDAPVERGEPMIEFYAAVTRKSLKGESPEGWHPEQAVHRDTALRMLTMYPAMAAFELADKGTIFPGKLADFTVLSADIMKIPAAEILKTKCVMTIIGGEVVYGAPGGL